VEGDIFADALQAESAYFSEVEKKRAEAAARWEEAKREEEKAAATKIEAAIAKE